MPHIAPDSMFEDAPLVWRKSRRSDTNGACVEVADLHDNQVAVRDSKNPTGPVLVFTAGEWSAFLAAGKTGPLEP